jgi:ABC-2 type transport system permease protein
MTSTGAHMGEALASFSSWANLMAATFRRDMWTATSYRVGFAISLGGSVISVLGLFFLSRAFGGSTGGSLDAYGGSYFGFAVIGVALSNLMALGLTGMAARIREGQMMGTLELMLLSPNRLGVLFLSSSLWAHAQAFVTMILMVLFSLVLGIDFGRANLGMTLLSLGLAILAFNAFGLLSAAVVIVVKQGNPVALLVSISSILLAGVFYPVTVLPSWLQAAGQLLPLTQALELVRRAALGGEGMATLWHRFVFLSLLTLILIPVGLLACKQAVRIAQTDGSLSQY